MHHAFVIGIQPAGLAQFDELLKVGNPGDLFLFRVCRGAADGMADAIELVQVAGDVHRVGNDPLDLQAGDMHQFIFPATDMGFGGGNNDLLLVDLDRQNFKTVRVGRGHNRSHRGDIDLERIDSQIRQFNLVCQPLGQCFQVKEFSRLSVFPLLLGNNDQGMDLQAGTAGRHQELLGLFFVYQPVGMKIVDNLPEIEFAIRHHALLSSCHNLFPRPDQSAHTGHFKPAIEVLANGLGIFHL